MTVSTTSGNATEPNTLFADGSTDTEKLVVVGKSPVRLEAFNLPASAVITFERVTFGKGTAPSASGCCFDAGTTGKIIAARPYKMCGCTPMLNASNGELWLYRKGVYRATLAGGSGIGFVMATADDDAPVESASSLGCCVAAATPPPPAPSFALGGAGTPLPCPVVFPVTYPIGGNAYNNIATLKAAIELDQSVTLAYTAANCTFTQTGGVGVFVNPNVAPATVVAVTPCPPVFPMVWTVDGTTYPSLSAFKAAFDAYYSVTSQYSTTPTCQLTILTGDVSPLPVASLTATNKLVLSPCPTFPAQWHGQVYATVTAFATGVASQGAGWSYDIATCTINAPQGVAIPTAPTAAPTAPITGVACPVVYPVVYPATTGATYANQAAFDASIEAQLGVSVTVSSTVPCQVVQTSGAVGLLPASIAVSSPVAALPVCLVANTSNTNLSIDDCAGTNYGRLVQLSGNPACASIASQLEPVKKCITGAIVGYMLKPALGPATVGGISFTEPQYEWKPTGNVLVGWATL